MEIDELKSLINEKPVSYSRKELEGIFEVKTKRTLDGINRKMRWDMILMIITVLGLIAVVFLLGLKDKFSLSIELIFLMTVVTIHYRIKHYKVNQVDLSRYDLATGLVKSVNSLKLYLKLYRTVIPLLAGVFYGYQRWIVLSIKDEFPAQLDEILIEAGLFVLVAAVVWFITLWISKKLYGKELKTMESYLRQLN